MGTTNLYWRQTMPEVVVNLNFRYAADVR